MSNRRRDSLNVLVVDDSAVVREVMTAVLSQEPGMTVMVAANPFIATNKMRRQRPDVIVLDLEMPGMHGLTFLRKIMKEDPIPVVVCSAFTGQGTSIGLRALEEGAVDAVTKPRFGVREFLHESAVTLIDSVRAAAQANPTSQRAVLPLPEPRLVADAILPTKLKSTSDKAKIVAIGASTGGTEALRLFLQAMPPDSPGLIIAQHMPEGFTSAFAKRLNEVCRIEVKEVANGDRIVTGQALIAPGNRHTAVRRIATQYIAEVIDGPLVCRHRPSVDVLFRSVAQAAGPNAIGVIMTGMGGDGAAGLLEMKQAGALTIAQDEASCVVFGMPKEAIDRGAVSRVVSLPCISDVILSAAGRHHRLFAGVE